MASPSKKVLEAQVNQIQGLLDSDEIEAPLTRIFGEKMALVLENEANIRAIPLNAMITIVFCLAVLFMPGKLPSFNP